MLIYFLALDIEGDYKEIKIQYWQEYPSGFEFVLNSLLDLTLWANYFLYYYSIIVISEMGCLCPRKGSTDNEYHIMTSDDARSHTGDD